MPPLRGLFEQTFDESRLRTPAVVHEAQSGMHGVLSEPSIRFPLRFVIKLIDRALMGKGRIANAVLHDVGRLFPYQRGLEIEKNAFVRPAGAIVMDGAHDRVLLRKPVAPTAKWGYVELDLDSEVLAHAANGVGEIVEPDLGICACVGYDDVAAVAADELIEPKILEMAAVRQMDRARAQMALDRLIVEARS